LVVSKQQPVKASNEASIKYLTSEELLIVPYPQIEYEKITSFNSEEWSEQFEMLNMLRRLLKHHKDCVTKQSVHSLLLSVLTLVESLRSSVSKNALIALNDMFEHIPRLIESELDILLPTLLKKCTDTNIFIASEADSALATMCSCCNESKAMAALLNLFSSVRNTAVKCKIAISIQMVRYK